MINVFLSYKRMEDIMTDLVCIIFDLIATFFVSKSLALLDAFREDKI